MDKDGKQLTATIPSFHSDKIAIDDNGFRAKLREEARAALLQSKSVELLTNQELQTLWTLLEQTFKSDQSEEPLTMDYTEFKRVANLSNNPKSRRYFTAVVFSKLLVGTQRRKISVVTFFNYVMKHVWTQQTRIGLTLYDGTGEGFLLETDLDNYILDLIPTLPQLGNMEKSFYPFYLCMSVRKFFFFLDPFRTGKIKIVDVLASSFLDDLVVELRDEDSKKADEDNWFSAESALRLYNQYIKLDEDQNGMLNQSELSRYGSGSLTTCFVNRIFEECTTYDKEIDFKTYVDFVLAMENKKEPQALLYFFKLLDINSKGFIDASVLYFFFKGLQTVVAENGQEPLNFEDIRNEIYDIVKPVKEDKITLADLINCGQGDTVISILADFGGYWANENRDAVPVDSIEEVEI